MTRSPSEPAMPLMESVKAANNPMKTPCCKKKACSMKRNSSKEDGYEMGEKHEMREKGRHGNGPRASSQKRK